MIKFDELKYLRSLQFADEFYEASIRCNFKYSQKLNQIPLMIPEFTNKALACELYLKATLYLHKIESPKSHNLKILFCKLSDEIRISIYHIWLNIEKTNAPDVNYLRKMFKDNLEAVSKVFEKFRYTHEWWSGGRLSLESSFDEDQMHLHDWSFARPMGSPPIYDGFLDQLVKAIKQYHNQYPHNT